MPVAAVCVLLLATAVVWSRPLCHLNALLGLSSHCCHQPADNPAGNGNGGSRNGHDNHDPAGTPAMPAADGGAVTPAACCCEALAAGGGSPVSQRTHISTDWHTNTCTQEGYRCGCAFRGFALFPPSSPESATADAAESPVVADVARWLAAAAATVAAGGVRDRYARGRPRTPAALGWNQPLLH